MNDFTSFKLNITRLMVGFVVFILGISLGFYITMETMPAGWFDDMNWWTFPVLITIVIPCLAITYCGYLLLWIAVCDIKDEW